MYIYIYICMYTCVAVYILFRYSLLAHIDLLLYGKAAQHKIVTVILHCSVTCGTSNLQGGSNSKHYWQARRFNFSTR